MSDEELQQMNKEQLLGIIKAQRFEISILKDDKEHLGEFLKEKDEEIERLNNLLKETSQTLSEQTTKAITLKSENERLNKELKSLQDSYDIEEEQANYHIDLTDDLREEVDRLNNIINELEKWLERIESFTSIVCVKDIKEKIKELKGSDIVE